MNGAPSQLDLFDYKPQARRAVRQGPARLHPQRPAHHHHDQRPVALARRAVDVQVRAAREMRHVGQRAAAEDRRDRRRHRARSRPSTPTAINHDPACTFVMTGSEDARQGEPRLVAFLRPRQREQRPARPSSSSRRSWSAKANAQALFTRMWRAAFCRRNHTGVALRARRRSRALHQESARRGTRRSPRACSMRSTSSTN